MNEKTYKAFNTKGYTEYRIYYIDIYATLLLGGLLSLIEICNSNIDYCLEVNSYYPNTTNLFKLLNEIVRLNKEIIKIHDYFITLNYRYPIVNERLNSNDLIDFYDTYNYPKINITQFSDLKNYLFDLYEVSNNTLLNIEAVIRYNT